ncbi:hypothetical protein [Salipaludibacillus sp. CF4.18]|uniref:hypothetical protein n=1 Tax=Salipaludibacillus sp. CF4.18 TaxID=3373081 RepID=UPI003EE62F39
MFWTSTRKKKILEATLAECPICNEANEINLWNQLVCDTYGDHSPDIRTAALNKKNTFPYQCPTCFKGFSAHRIKFSKSNENGSFETKEFTSS